MKRDIALAALSIGVILALAGYGVLNWYTAHIRWGY